MFLGIVMFLALIRAHLNLTSACAKMSLGRAQNIFMPSNTNSVLLVSITHMC